MMNTLVSLGEDKVTFEAISLLRTVITKTALRDVLLSIARESPAFSMLKVIRHLIDFAQLM